jgi:hypothetical protein
VLVRHGSLNANTVATVTLTRTSPSTVTPANDQTRHYVNNSFKFVEVVNRSTTSIFFNFVEFSGNVALGSPGSPVVNSNDSYVVPPGGALTVPVHSQSITSAAGTRTYEARVRLVAAATAAYSVTAP